MVHLCFWPFAFAPFTIGSSMPPVSYAARARARLLPFPPRTPSGPVATFSPPPLRMPPSEPLTRLPSCPFRVYCRCDESVSRAPLQCEDGAMQMQFSFFRLCRLTACTTNAQCSSRWTARLCQLDYQKYSHHQERTKEGHASHTYRNVVIPRPLQQTATPASSMPCPMKGRKQRIVWRAGKDRWTGHVRHSRFAALAESRPQTVAEL
ncbi:hypothetical protein BKA81DRAFT_351597, partial [Phyllosticta paracitricarpa]